MTPEKRALIMKRRDVVLQIRAYLKEHLTPEGYQIRSQAIPRCKSCEFYSSSGICCGGVTNDPEHAYGHKVTDVDDVCLSWEISYDEYCAALAKVGS